MKTQADLPQPYGAPVRIVIPNGPKAYVSSESVMLASCLAQNRQISVSFFPRRKEILPSLSTLGCIICERCCARQSEMRQWIQRRERRVASVIENLLKFRRRFRPAPQFQVGLAAQVLRPEFGRGFVAGRCLQLFYHLRRIAASQLQRRADRRQPD